MPKKIITRLKYGSKRRKRRSRLLIQNKIIATNQDCLNTMAIKSRMLGFTTKIHSSLKDDVSVSAKKIVKSIPKRKNSCLIFGGEPTVKVVGSGKGGRNQELVLQILKLTHNSDDHLLISSVTTDGIDGNTEYSGAINADSELFKNTRAWPKTPTLSSSYSLFSCQLCRLSSSCTFKNNLYNPYKNLYKQCVSEKKDGLILLIMFFTGIKDHY